MIKGSDSLLFKGKLMKGPYVMACVILVIIVSLGLFVRSGMDMVFNKSVKYGKLLSVSYSNSGDMNGNTNIIRLDVEKLLVITQYAVWHHDPLEVKEYSITQNDVDILSSMIKEENILKLSKLPMGDLFAYDAPTTTLTFVYDNSNVGGSSYDNYSINYYMKLSNKDYTKLKRITNYLNSLVRKDNMVRSYKEDR